MASEFYATCPNQLVDVLADEIAELGGSALERSYGAVYFSCDLTSFYRMHLRLRTASRIYRILREVPAHSPTILFDKLKRIRFGDFFPPELPFKIDVVTGSSRAGQESKLPGHLAGSKVREAIVDSLKHFHGVEAKSSSWDAKVFLKAFHNPKTRRLMISLETSGEPLHRRGYRLTGHPAPIKESLAAALLRVVGYDGSTAFVDGMCGSGTLAIEAAQIAHGIPPSAGRDDASFSLTQLEGFDSKVWKELRKETLEHPSPGPVFARDLSDEFVSLTKESAAIAGVARAIDVRREDFFASQAPAASGVLVINIPYGERLEANAEFLGRVVAHIKDNYRGWRCGLLIPKPSKDFSFRTVGIKPDKRLRLRNGRIDVEFVVFSVFPG